MSEYSQPIIPIPDAAPAWVDGFKARIQGLRRLENPYFESEEEREDQWDNGWLFAESEIARGDFSKRGAPPKG
jgi:hypothetical protein